MDSNHTVEKPVILFDGVCNLCDSSVQFIIKRDKKNRFRFASLQSSYAKKNLTSSLVNDEELKSIVIQHGDHIKVKSDAVLTIAKSLSGLWPILYAFIIVPKFIRDSVYDFIANNRYKWFGKKDQCMIPSPDLRSRFID